jgi:hypothetical protein
MSAICGPPADGADGLTPALLLLPLTAVLATPLGGTGFRAYGGASVGIAGLFILLLIAVELVVMFCA